ncbi:putative surface protein SACOL0050 isoform X15 [Sebastes umbrosus]|uniref:putative surface protein SACOL0050 isoform X15 n=1 Tax=Sebastes umbrosus TaxID=72105 RepID=UPI00189E3BD9|nr:putative surface protein SACOL0050 isoform X15 [Sebastes umbrosus]
MNTSANNSNKDQLPIPRGYEYQKVLAEGNNTQVIKCVKPRTRETMVVKIGKNGNDLSHEVKVLGDLREHDMTRFNIVDFLGTVIINGKTGLKFETLDIGLLDYIRKEGGQMHLEDIRKVIEQLAFALYGLKTQGMIHTDVKPDNIMLTNRNRIPLRVKLIDFGKAIYKSDVKPDTDAEPVYNRFLSAPENLLGLPFSEAIDMWSLGCVLGIMLTGRTLFPDTNSHDTLRSMIDLLGPPPKHLIDAGLRSKMFFEKSISDEWILKEHPGSADDSPDDPPDTFHSLETLKAMRLEKNNDKEADQRGACIDLLKEMLRWDGRLRISPNAISNHPFLTRRYHESNLPLRSCISLPAGIVMVQPAAPENSTQLEKTSDLDSEKCVSPPSGVIMVQPAAPKKSIDLDRKKCVSPPSGVIMVQPAAPENDIDLDEESDDDSETSSSSSSNSDLDEIPDLDNERIVSLPSGVVMVQPAAPENNIDLDETSDEDSDTSVSPPSCVIMVQPAAPENNIDLDEDWDEDSETCSSPPSGVIMVQPAAPENDIVLDEIPDLHNERIFSLPGGISMVVSSAPKSRTHLDEESDEDSDASSSSSSGSDLDEDSDEDGETIFSPPSGVIANQPAAPVINIDLEEIPDRDNERIFSLPGGISMVVSSAPKNRTHLDEESDEDSDASSSSSSGSDLDEDSDEDGETISSSSSGSDLDEDSDEDGETIFSPPSGVIANQPAAPVINIDLEEIPDRDNERIVSLPSGVVMVQPAASEDNIDLDEESDEDSDTSSSSSSGSDLDEDSDEDGETIFSPPSGVIANQPAAPVINIDLEEIPDRDNERIYSLPGGISMVVSSGPKNRRHLEKTSDEDGETMIHPDNEDLSPDTSDKKKKKKNGFKRFLSWMKKAICPCCNVKNVQD